MFFSLLLAYKMVTRLTDTPTIMLPTLSPLSFCLFGQLIPKLAPGEIVQLTFVFLSSPFAFGSPSTSSLSLPVSISVSLTVSAVSLSLSGLQIRSTHKFSHWKLNPRQRWWHWHWLLSWPAQWAQYGTMERASVGYRLMMQFLRLSRDNRGSLFSQHIINHCSLSL